MAMPLFLTTLLCPEGVRPERREMSGGSISIGRGTESDWTLPDPDRVLSKRHCLISMVGDGWLVADHSANGTRLNGHDLEVSLPRPLRDRDRLTMGGYEFEVRIGEAPEPEISHPQPRPGSMPGHLDHDRLTGDPFSSVRGDALEAVRPSVGLPLDFEALDADGDAVPENPYAAPDDTPDLHAHFTPPRPSLDLLPADWDLDEEPVPGPRALPPAATPLTAPHRSFDAAEAARVPDARAAFAALAAGARIAGPMPADPDEALRGLGAAFRAVVSGLRRIMIARATIKGEFRIEQTMIRAVGNNPLKFAADDDDALAALLGIGRQGGMGPEGAIGEALRDMRVHELAVTASMQTAVRDLLTELAPERIASGTSRRPFDALFGWGKRAGWDAYVARHSEIMRSFEDDFDSVFGRSFVRAYEAAHAALAKQEEP